MPAWASEASKERRSGAHLVIPHLPRRLVGEFRGPGLSFGEVGPPNTRFGRRFARVVHCGGTGYAPMEEICFNKMWLEKNYNTVGTKYFAKKATENIYITRA